MVITFRVENATVVQCNSGLLGFRLRHANGSLCDHRKNYVNLNIWPNGLEVRYLLWVYLIARDPGFDSQLGPLFLHRYNMRRPFCHSSYQLHAGLQFVPFMSRHSPVIISLDNVESRRCVIPSVDTLDFEHSLFA